MEIPYQCSQPETIAENKSGRLR